MRQHCQSSFFFRATLLIKYLSLFSLTVRIKYHMNMVKNAITVRSMFKQNFSWHKDTIIKKKIIMNDVLTSKARTKSYGTEHNSPILIY